MYSDPVLRFHKSPGTNDQNILREECQKEQIEYNEGGMIAFCQLRSCSYAMLPFAHISE